MAVLVTAASKHGATEEIAEAIARSLAEEGVETELRPPASVESVADYEAVVVGSAVYMGRWLEPAKTFLEKHREELASRPVWMFSSGPVGDPPKPDRDAAVDASDVFALVEPREHAVFSGKLDASKLRFTERTMMKAVRACEGDFREWDEIARWTKRIAAEVKAKTPAAPVG